jgi:hypothetical protein
MYHFGTLKNGEKRLTEVFYSTKKPTEQTHGHLYGFTTGGYKTKKEAMNQANYQNVGKVVFFDGRKKECITTRNLFFIAGIV